MTRIEITEPDQFTKDELFTIWEMTRDWGFEWPLDADRDKVEALRVKVEGLIEKIIEDAGLKAIEPA